MRKRFLLARALMAAIAMMTLLAGAMPGHAVPSPQSITDVADDGFPAVGATSADFATGDIVSVSSIGNPSFTRLNVFDLTNNIEVFDQTFAGNGSVSFTIPADSNYLITYEVEITPGQNPPTATLTCGVGGGTPPTPGGPPAATPDDFSVFTVDHLVRPIIENDSGVAQVIADRFSLKTARTETSDPTGRLRRAADKYKNFTIEELERRLEHLRQRSKLRVDDTFRHPQGVFEGILDLFGAPFADGRGTITHGEQYYIKEEIEVIEFEIERRREENSVIPDLSGITVLAFTQTDTSAPTAFVNLSQAARVSDHSDVIHIANGIATNGQQKELPFSLWAAARHRGFDDNGAAASRDGHLTTVWVGGHYQASANFNVGGYGLYRNAEVDSTALAAELNSDAYGLGTYLNRRLYKNIILSAGAEYTHGDNELNIGAVTGFFDTDEVKLRADLAGVWQRDNYWVQPGVGMTYTYLERESFVNSAGVFVPSSSLELGRLRFGPRAGLTLAGDREVVSTIAPTAWFIGTYDVINDGDFTLGAGTVQTPDLGATIGGSVAIGFVNRVKFEIGSDYSFYDNGSDAWSIRTAGAAPLSFFGIGDGNNGNVSLNLNTSGPGEWNARVSAEIPLN